MKNLSRCFLAAVFLSGCAGHVLTISTTPADADVVIIPLNGAPAPYTPNSRYSEGEYAVKVSRPGYITENYHVTLNGDERLDAVLKQANHRFRVSVVPADALARLNRFRGGEPVEYSGDIPEEEYLLTVSRKGYKNYETIVVLNRDVFETVTLAPEGIDSTGTADGDKKEPPDRLFAAEYLRVGLSPNAKEYLTEAVKTQNLKILLAVLEQIKTDMDMKYAISALESEGGEAGAAALGFIYFTGYLARQDREKAREYLDKAALGGERAALCLKMYALLKEDRVHEAEELAKTPPLTEENLAALKRMGNAEVKDIMRCAAGL